MGAGSFLKIIKKPFWRMVFLISGIEIYPEVSERASIVKI